MDFRDVITLSAVGMTKTFDLSHTNVLDTQFSTGKNERLCWGTAPDSSMFFFSAGQGKVQRISLANGEVVSTSCHNYPADTSDCIGLSVDNELVVCSKTSGSVYTFNAADLSPKASFSVGDNLTFCKAHRSVLMCGGKECALGVWDVQNTKEAVFRAKNVRADTLDLKVPIWLSDASFVEGQEHIFVTTSKYGEFCVYDIRSGQRRPVSRSAWRISRKQGKKSVGTGQTPAMLRDLAISRPVTRVVAFSGPGVGLRAVAGNAIGDICLLDFRVPASVLFSMNSNSSSPADGKRVKDIHSIGSLAAVAPLNVQTFIPATGSVSALVCGGAGCANLPHLTPAASINSQPLVLSSSIDRFFRIYDLNSGELLSKIFVKIPISTFLVRDSAKYCLDQEKPRAGKQDFKNAPDFEEANKESDEIWAKMQPVVLKTVRPGQVTTEEQAIFPSKRKK